MSYTKGPWLIAGEDKMFVYALGPKGTNLFCTRVDKVGPEKISDREAEANARLISKAPEMLEKLKEASLALAISEYDSDRDLADLIDILIAEIEGDE